MDRVVGRNDKPSVATLVRQEMSNMRLGELLSLQLSHLILKIHTFCAVLGCQNRQK